MTALIFARFERFAKMSLPTDDAKNKLQIFDFLSFLKHLIFTILEKSLLKSFPLLKLSEISIPYFKTFKLLFLNLKRYIISQKFKTMLLGNS